MTQQLTLSLEPGIATRYRSLRECMATGVYQRGVVAVAGKIDKQPSHLSEALASNDRRKLDVDDLEAYIERTGDTLPVLYLVAKFLQDPAVVQQEALAKIASLAEQLPALLAAVGMQVGKAGRR